MADDDKPADPEATQAMDHVEPEPAPEPETPPAATPSALDDLFGDSNFQEYDEGLIPTDASAGKPVQKAKAAQGPVAPPERASRTQKLLIAVVGSLVALVALFALFILGTKLPAVLAKPAPAPTKTATPTPTPTPTPTSTVKPVGPVSVGVHGWNALLGGECLDPYTTPFAEKFTVVDCAVAHPAQMVFRGTFDTSAGPAFPGPDALQQKISLLCSAPGVVNLAAAGQYTDAQVQGSYPVTADEWAAGQHDYFCFISRSSGQPLTGSVAAAPAAP